MWDLDPLAQNAQPTTRTLKQGILSRGFTKPLKDTLEFGGRMLHLPPQGILKDSSGNTAINEGEL
jgi:hypothetical protein